MQVYAYLKKIYISIFKMNFWNFTLIILNFWKNLIFDEKNILN